MRASKRHVEFAIGDLKYKRCAIDHQCIFAGKSFGEFGVEHRAKSHAVPFRSREPRRIRCHLESQTKADQRMNNWFKFLASFSEVIATVQLTNQAGGLHLAEARREQVSAHAGQIFEQLSIATGPQQKLPHHKERPTLADHIKRMGQGTTLSVGTLHLKNI